ELLPALPLESVQLAPPIHGCEPMDERALLVGEPAKWRPYVRGADGPASQERLLEGGVEGDPGQALPQLDDPRVCRGVLRVNEVADRLRPRRRQPAHGAERAATHPFLDERLGPDEHVDAGQQVWLEL